ncbi:hypothetical protein [Aerosakkonema funiforme]|uniref:hypothetical protein n=1 Tax=Aerosakkonema funiforme TaxID=1246630 RepID=UPI0035BC7079
MEKSSPRPKGIQNSSGCKEGHLLNIKPADGCDRKQEEISHLPTSLVEAFSSFREIEICTSLRSVKSSELE